LAEPLKTHSGASLEKLLIEKSRPRLSEGGIAKENLFFLFVFFSLFKYVLSFDAPQEISNLTFFSVASFVINCLSMDIVDKLSDLNSASPFLKQFESPVQNRIQNLCRGKHLFDSKRN